VELDSGEWVLAGDRERQEALARVPLSKQDGLSVWRDYRKAFASDDVESAGIQDDNKVVGT
jgi:hypothetical protein